MALRIIPGEQAPVVSFMTTMDQGQILPGHDDVPGMVIHPEATAGALFAVAQSRLANLEKLAEAVSPAYNSREIRGVPFLSRSRGETSKFCPACSTHFHAVPA